MWIDDRLKLRKDKTKEKIDFYNISSGNFFYYVFFYLTVTRRSFRTLKGRNEISVWVINVNFRMYSSAFKV